MALAPVPMSMPVSAPARFTACHGSQHAHGPRLPYSHCSVRSGDCGAALSGPGAGCRARVTSPPEAAAAGKRRSRRSAPPAGMRAALGMVAGVRYVMTAMR